VAHFNLDDYETVEDRLIKYWKDNPNGRIFTRLLEHSPSRFIVEAAVFRTADDVSPWATGLAEETIQGRGVNATSALENCETSAIGRALANAGYATKGKRPTREEMAKVAAKNVAQSAIAEAKAKMAQTASEYVPVPKENDPWAIRDAAPAATVDEAVNMVKEIIGGQTERDIPKCKGCQEPKEMSWKTGQGKNGKPYGKMDCFACKDIIWYEIAPDGTWRPQKAKW
jgi:hypothetical protein